MNFHSAITINLYKRIIYNLATNKPLEEKHKRIVDKIVKDLNETSK